MTTITTIGDLIDNKYEVRTHCLDCDRHAILDLQAIAASHGRALVFVGEQSPLQRHLRCRCGSRNATVRIHPPTPAPRFD